MRGGIILSNRLRAMQEAAENFGEGIDGIRMTQRKMAQEDEDRKAAASSRALQDRASQQVIDQNDFKLAEFKRADAARQERDTLAGEIAGFGQAVPENAIDPGKGLPGFQAQQSMRPVSDTTSQALQDRLRASWMNADAKAKGESSIFTAADVQKQRAEGAAKKQREEQEYALGIDKTKADIESTQTSTKRAGMEIKKLEAEIVQIGKGGMDPEKVATVEGKLRGEFINQNKVFMDVRDAWSRVNASGDDAAGDLSLIFNYMKMLDPGSTVREGEFATAQNAAGVPDRILNAYNNSLQGTRLSKGQREQFKGQAGKLYESQKSIYTNNAKTYMGLAADYGVNPARVAVDLEGGVQGTQAPAAPAAAGNRDSEAVAWAKANPTDPRATKILQLNGAR